MVYFTLFPFDPTNFISFDQYLAITSNAHWWIVKWWLWLHTYSSTSKWSDRVSFQTAQKWPQLYLDTSQKVAKTIQVQRLWKEAHRPWPGFAEWPILNFTFKRGLFVPQKELTEFVCSCFETLDFVEGDILSIDQVTRSAMYILKYYDPKCEFCCQYHLDWGVKFASKIVVNVYFNNKQKHAKDCVHKDSVESLKTRQRRK